MTISEMLTQSGYLTLLGMAVVFTFLVILIICMNGLRLFVRALKLDKEAPKVDAPASAAPSVDEKAVVAAIATAIKEKSN